MVRRKLIIRDDSLRRPENCCNLNEILILWVLKRPGAFSEVYNGNVGLKISSNFILQLEKTFDTGVNYGKQCPLARAGGRSVQT